MNLISEIPSSLVRHIPIKEVILQAGIADISKTPYSDVGDALLICDENTKDFLEWSGRKIILPGNQKAELKTAQEISRNNASLFIALGSGSLNDIVKYAAHLAKKPYIVFGTAPSMNGYVSANSSLLDNGYKKSFTATAPQAVYLDLEILSAAPKRLINSGIGDSICRGTVEADAILASEITGADDYPELFSLIKRHEDEIFDDITALAKTLVYGGLAMLLAHSSAPASGGEHMIAHYMELMQPTAPESFHGEQVAVATVAMAKLQEKLLGSSFTAEIAEEKINAHFGTEFGAYCISQTAKKYINLLGRTITPDYSLIKKVMLNSTNLEAKLKAVGAPVKPSDIGWDENKFAHAITYGKYTRDRFTFLDLV